MATGPSSRPAGRTAGTLKVLVVDDHPIVRKGLVELVGDSPDLAVCGEAGDIATALRLAAATSPDVAIVDLSLGLEDGLDLVSALRTSQPQTRVLVLSAHDERTYADRSIKAGALGYVAKAQAPTELLAAVRRVGEGKTYLSAEAMEFVLATIGTRRPPEAEPQLARLSDRERHVLRLVGRGLSTREIAVELQLSVKTVESHYAHIKQKLGLRNSRELTRAAVVLSEQTTL